MASATAEAVLGRRIVVTGLAGSGKSTLSIELARRTGLPLVHLDLEFWTPGWVAPTEAAFRERQARVLAGAGWIADGNYPDSLALRIDLADTVVVLDLPWWRCSLRALRRGLRMPGELPAGCTFTRWERLRDEWRLAFRISKDRRTEPQRERQVIAEHAGHASVFRLRSRREVSAFLDRWAPLPA